MWAKLTILLLLATSQSRIVRFQEDIPDINCHYTGRQKVLDDLARPVQLWTGGDRRAGEVRLGSLGGTVEELECVMDAREVLVDVMVWDFGLDASSFRLGDEGVSPYFAGDLLLTCPQANALLNILDPGGAPDNRRSLSIDDLIDKWEWTVYFTYDETIGGDEELKEMIKSAFEMWSKDSCMSFPEFVMRPGNPPSEDYIVFTDRGGCGSQLGRVGGAQAIHLGKAGCRDVGIIAHLIGHSLGLLHAQQRQDAGRELLVDWHGLKPAFADAFLPVPGYLPSTPFDFGSLMLSKKSAFAKDPLGRPVAEPSEEPGFLHTMGSKRTGPSFGDVKQLNQMYCWAGGECAGKAPKHGGYRAPWDCAKEVCPEGYTWTGCGTMADGEPSFCGGLLFAGSSPREFQSPNFPAEMPVGQKCNWVIHAPTARHKVQLEFVELDMPVSEPCQWGFVEVRAGNDSTATGQRFCAQRKPQDTITSQNRQMLVFLRSTDPAEAPRGFKARYWSVERPDDDSSPPPSGRGCRDRISTESCRRIFEANGKCSVPKAGELCAATCRRCGDRGDRGPCRDELSRETCRRQFIATDRCGTPRARRRCKDSCGRCGVSGQSGGTGFKAQNLDDDSIRETVAVSGPKEVGDPPVISDLDNRAVTYFVTEGSFHGSGLSPPEEQAFHLDCGADGAVPMVYEWFRRTRDGQWTARVSKGQDEVRPSNDGRRLRFLNPRADAAGTYRCTAKNLFGIAVSQEFRVEEASIEADERIGASGGREERVRAVNGRWATMPCRPAQLDSVPAADVKWYRLPVGWEREDALLLQDGDHERISFSKDHSLILHHIQSGDVKDHYFCAATNDVTQESIYGATFYVSGNDQLTPFRGEEIQSSEEQTTAVEGKPVQLDCFRSGYPDSEITPEWYKDGRRLRGDRYKSRNSGKSLYIASAAAEDTGAYECRFRRNVRVRFRLDLETTPRWRHIDAATNRVSVPDLTSDAAREICAVEGEPAPSLTVYHNGFDGVVVAEGVQVRGVASASDGVARDEVVATYGVYQCHAENAHGSVWANVYQQSPRHQFRPVVPLGRGRFDDLVERRGRRSLDQRSRRSLDSACHDEDSESVCVLRVLGKHNCTSEASADACRKTCGLCSGSSRDVCSSASELCPTTGPLGGSLCRESAGHPHLRPWCRRCGFCQEEEEPESGPEASSETMAVEAMAEDGVCADRLSHEECMGEVLGDGGCLQRADLCEETCGLCHTHPEDRCRTQRLDCGEELCESPETKPNVLRWCRGCGYCTSDHTRI